MKTTLKVIWDMHPCNKNDDSGGWGLLTKNLGTDNLSTEVSIIQILESNGIKDAIWALRCFDYKDYCLFVADVSESVLSIFESKHPDDKRPRLAIQGVRDYNSSKISKKELMVLAADAADAADAAAAAAADAAYDYAAAYGYAAAYDYAAASAAAASDADADADAAAADAADAADADAAATDAAYDYAAIKEKWKEIEVLFRKHFGDSE